MEGYCNKCGTKLIEGAEFCMHCGEKTQQPTVTSPPPPTAPSTQPKPAPTTTTPPPTHCPKCGVKLVEGAKFCMNCSEPIQQSAPVKSPSSPTEPPVPSQPAPASNSLPSIAPTAQPETTPTAASPLTYCPKCGVKLLEGAKFCMNCSKPVQQPTPVKKPPQPSKPAASSKPKPAPVATPPPPKTHCPKCGVKLVEGAKFCMNCSEPV